MELFVIDISMPLCKMSTGINTSRQRKKILLLQNSIECSNKTYFAILCIVNIVLEMRRLTKC